MDWVQKITQNGENGEKINKKNFRQFLERVYCYQYPENRVIFDANQNQIVTIKDF